jgi:hypothetical protein
VDRSGKAVDEASLLPGRERRSSPRVRSRIGASYEDEDRHVFLHTVDLSEDGIFLASPTHPPLGASAVVLLELPGDPAILRLRGRVARQQTQPVGGFAVRFDSQGLSEGSRRALRDFVQGADSGAPSPQL